MDGLHFDAYTPYSDHSAPRTPSPNQPIMNFGLKQVIEEQPVRIFNDPHHPHHHPDDNAVVVTPENVQYGSWAQAPPPSGPFQFSHSNSSRGSLLGDMYDSQDLHHTPEFPSNEPQFVQNQPWGVQDQSHARPHEYQMMRRATFPYVRHDRDDGLALQPIPQFYPSHQQPQIPSQQQMQNFRQQPLYSDGLQLPDPNLMNDGPQGSFHHYEDGNIKLEDNNGMMGPSQQYYPPPGNPSGYPLGMPYHTGLPVQHTDDAASKETQYLRRRCFNCHTTEPPSWRRSTLNPGKIVCNKCGLYERTHLRPRPLRFDELRAGNKARKGGKRTLSPKSRPNASSSPRSVNGGVKKEPREYGLNRRSSVSSASSVHSGGGASDWDDSVSIYSSGSAPPTSFNSPNVSPFPLSRDDSSSPPNMGNGGIRLPNAPLTDIASMGTPGSVTQSPLHGSPAPLPSQMPGSVPHTPNIPGHALSGVGSPQGQQPRKSHTSPEVFFSSSQQQQEEFFLRRNSVSHQSQQGSPAVQQQDLLASPASMPSTLS
ncbi:hypothetical protein BKA70DRAFT_1093690 [Coprinopsis sp. MPI-PUGE-AT-0042]|nr:hypothetical protein BKA70DRAFT_1093690 [Coprinopsis sp. MPI-PUGE-AT-0042]